MARKGKKFRIQRRFSGEFHCKCGLKWEAHNLQIQETRECGCGEHVWPTKVHMTSAIESDDFAPQEDTKYFGQFQCFRCLRTWFSAHVWIGFGQKCRNCHIFTDAHRINELRRPKGMDRKNDPKKVHEKELCLKCKQLGFNCNQLKYRSKNR